MLHVQHTCRIKVELCIPAHSTIQKVEDPVITCRGTLARMPRSLDRFGTKCNTSTNTFEATKTYSFGKSKKKRIFVKIKTSQATQEFPGPSRCMLRHLLGFFRMLVQPTHLMAHVGQVHSHGHVVFPWPPLHP